MTRSVRVWDLPGDPEWSSCQPFRSVSGSFHAFLPLPSLPLVQEEKASEEENFDKATEMAGLQKFKLKGSLGEWEEVVGGSD